MAYQSVLDQGFVHQTVDFANNDFFPITSMRPTNYGMCSQLFPSELLVR